MNRNKQWLTILTVALLMFHVAAGEEEEEVFEEQPLSSAEKYVDFLSNGGAVSEYPDEEVDQDAVDASNTADYESETLDMLLKNFQSSFDELTPQESKDKLEEHVHDMDLDGDGFVSREEFSKWLIAQAEKGATLDAMGMSGIDSFDLNQDNKLSWHEVFEDLRKLGNIESAEFKKGIEMEKVRFAHADRNKDKVLDESEYPRYASPEYFTEMANYSILSYIADYDHDRDLKISREEFVSGFDSKTDIEGYKYESAKFDKMDQDKDGYLTAGEVSSVALEFSIQTFAGQRVNNVFFHVDTDKDGKLSKLEILSSYPLFTKGKAEEDPDLEFKHDEL